MDSVLKMKNLCLYVALYALDGALRDNGPNGPQEYYWTFIVAPENAPKEQECIRYRVRKVEGFEKLDPGKVEFEKIVWKNDISLVPSGRHDDIVARVLIAEVGDAKGMEEHIQDAWPEKTIHVKKTGAIRTSQNWAQRVLEGLGGPSPGSLSGTRYMLSSKLADWKTIESCCTIFAKNVVVGSASLDTVPTFDILKNIEVTQ